MHKSIMATDSSLVGSDCASNVVAMSKIGGALPNSLNIAHPVFDESDLQKALVVLFRKGLESQSPIDALESRR